MCAHDHLSVLCEYATLITAVTPKHYIYVNFIVGSTTKNSFYPNSRNFELENCLISTCK